MAPKRLGIWVSSLGRPVRHTQCSTKMHVRKHAPPVKDQTGDDGKGGGEAFIVI